MRKKNAVPSVVLVVLIIGSVTMFVLPETVKASDGYLLPPYDDHGLDMDSPPDGYYDYLVVNASVNVTVPGSFTLISELWDGSVSVLISMDFNFRTLGVGVHVVTVMFSGWDITILGVDGPYHVNFYLYNVNFLDADSYDTGPYLASEFQPLPAQFSPPHSDHGVDTDVPPDSYYNTLVVDVSIDVNESGLFAVSGSLLDPGMNVIATASDTSYLGLGMNAVSLDFCGASIYLSGYDGPYTVGLMLRTYDEMGFPTWIDDDMYMTSAYSYTDFQHVTPATVWGHVLDENGNPPVFGGMVYVMNYSNAFIDLGMTDPDGYYEIDVFEGDFYVLGDSEMQAELEFVQVVGSTEQNFYLENPPVSYTAFTYSFSDWDNLTVEEDLEMEMDNQSYRLIIDYGYGNMNGYLEQNELDVFAGLMENMSVGPTSTIDLLYVNGTHYNEVQGSTSVAAFGEGPITLKEPLILQSTTDYVSASTIPPSPIHVIDLKATYDDEILTFDYTVNIPPSHPLAGYVDAENIAVSGLGTPTIAVDPLVSPEVNVYNAWVKLYVGTPETSPPMISDVLIDGQADVTYYHSTLPVTFNLTATIDDTLTGNLEVMGANCTSPTPTSWPGIPMEAADGRFDDRTEDVVATLPTPTVAGVYHYYVSGWDAVMNYNTTAPYATLTIVDDLAPEITDLSIDGQSSRTHFLSSLPAYVTLTAVVNDTATGGSTIAGANYTTPTPASWPGMPMDPEDGDFDSPAERMVAQIVTPTVPGEYDFYVFAWDSEGVSNNSAPHATLMVVDDIPPQVTEVFVNSQPSLRVKPGSEVVLSALIDDSSSGGLDVGGAEYTIGLGNWPGTPMHPSDGMFDSTQEYVNVTVDTTGWAEGLHEVCVYAWDNQPNYNMTGDCAQIVIDGTPPEITDIRVNGETTVYAKPGTEIALTATVTDVNTGGLPIAGGNYTVGASNWPGVSLGPADGNFDTSLEIVNITIDTRGWGDDHYDLCVYAWDEAGNVNSTATCVEIIVDGTPPVISDVLVEPDPQFLEEDLNISVIVTDNEGVVLVRLEYTEPDGIASQEIVMDFEPSIGRFLYTGNFTVAGEYSFTITAMDESGNTASESGTFKVRERAQPGFLDQYWLVIVIVIVLAVILILFLLRRRPAAVEAEDDTETKSEG
jgi:hypothetical protein